MKLRPFTGKKKTNGSASTGARNTGEENGKDTPTTASGKKGHFLNKMTPLLVLFVGYALLLVLYLPRPGSTVPDITIGRPSPVKLVAPRDLVILDHERTNQLRKKAAEGVIPVFTEHTQVQNASLEKVDAFFRMAQELALNTEISTALRRERLAALLNIPVEENAATLDLLLQYSRYSLLQDTLKNNLRQVYQNGVVPSADAWTVIQQHLVDGIHIVDEQNEMARRLNVEPILDMEGARQYLTRLIQQQFSKPIEDEGPRQLANFIIQLTLEPNLVLSEELWQEQRLIAMNQVTPIRIQIQRNQKILDEGEVVPQRLTLITQSGEQVSTDTSLLLGEFLRATETIVWSQQIAKCLMLLVPMILLGVYVRRYHHSVWRNPTTLTCLIGLIVAVVGIGQLLGYLGDALENLQHIGYATPVALAGLLITILVNLHLALFTVLVLALYSGILMGGFDFFAVHLIAGLVSIFSVSAIRRRIDLTWAGLKIAVAACGVATLFYLWEMGGIEKSLNDTHPWILLVIWTFLHGILTTMLAGLLLPLLESLMGVITDIQLLELSRKNEILRQLEAEAPGTYQHSQHVANLAESAADAIGANGLLARVASLYHDIGKLNKPVYFSENQVRENEKKTHEKLTPSMSRLLICNHIKDGQEMAEKYNLPDFIKDAISQHHGTTLLTYFYDKALQEDSKDVVNESDYRYPGPKPQSVEMAIIMLADSLEAASRSLPMGMTHGEMYQFVRKIINQKFMDGQFDECDLTLSDLHKLTEAFSRSLVSLLHRRIAYPTLSPASDTAPERQPSGKIKPEYPETGKTLQPVGSASISGPVHSSKGVTG